MLFVKYANYKFNAKIYWQGNCNVKINVFPLKKR